MKKLISIILIFSFLFSMIACSGQGKLITDTPEQGQSLVIYTNDGKIYEGLFIKKDDERLIFIDKDSHKAETIENSEISKIIESNKYYDFEGNEIIHFVYDDHNPWPEEPDGDGPTLVSIEENPTGDPASPYYWRASYRIPGSPFRNDRLGTSIQSPETDENLNNKILIYPNPSQGDLNIKRNINDDGDLMIVKIYSMSGVLLLETESDSNFYFNLKNLNLETGIYLVQVRLQDKIETKRLIYR